MGIKDVKDNSPIKIYMDYTFSMYLRKPYKIYRIYKIHKPKIKKIKYKPHAIKNLEDYESGFSFPATKRLTYVNKIVDDELEF
jgi:hypothetical protein